MLTSIIAVAFGSILSLSPVNATTGTGQVSPDVLRVAVGLSDVPSRLMAIGMSSLAKTRGLDFDIDTTWIRYGDSPTDRLSSGDVDIALVDSGAIDAGSSRLRAVMQYWAKDRNASENEADGNLHYIMIANDSLSSHHVEALVQAALQDDIVLGAARIDATRLTAEDALTDLPLPLHEGVENYLKGMDSSPILAPEEAPVETVAAIEQEEPQRSEPVQPSPIAPAPPKPLAALDQETEGRSFTLYFETGEASLDRSDYKSVAAACKFAATLARARFRISGHTDTVGSDDSNFELSTQRANAVADAIRNDPRFRDALSVVEFGETRLAVVTGDGVDEPMNRRVEITVIDDETIGRAD
jgi:outer membrane protein OmpA-like peptidoglycan-associated protein